MKFLQTFTSYLSILLLQASFSFDRKYFSTNTIASRRFTLSLMADTKIRDSVIFQKVEQSESGHSKQILLYLPGLDGFGAFSVPALGDKLQNYEVWKMSVLQEDRSTFIEIASKVINFVQSQNEPVVLMGESFGGLLATYVALRAKEHVYSMVLVNPATSFDRTSWPVLGQVLSKTGIWYGLSGTAVLAATIVDFVHLRAKGSAIINKIVTPDDALVEFADVLSYPKKVANHFPAETLAWRLRAWLMQGSHIMKDKYANISTPTLILVGAGDRLIPSSEEGRRLLREMKNAQVEVKEYPQGGHMILDGTIDLTDIFLNKNVFS